MNRWAPLVAASALALSTVGCSALGLDRFQFPACGACNDLNARDGIPVDAEGNPTACLAWRCDMGTGECRFGAFDADGDGHFPLACAGAAGVASPDDCDDADPDVFGGAPELCNGADDDCDGEIDDAYAPPAEGAIVLATTFDPGWVRASDLETGGVAIAFGGRAGAAFEVVRTATDVVVAGEPLGPASAMDVTRTAFGTASEIATAAGCPGGAFESSEIPCDPAMPGTCPATAPVCVTRTVAPIGSFCEAMLSFPSGYPTDGSLCRSSAECDDETFCNGRPDCAPSGGAGSVDARQCRLDARDACGADTRCDEDSRGCTRYSVTPCDIAHVAIAPTGGGEWFAPFVTTSNCSSGGSVRLGYFDDDPTHTDPARFPQRAILQRGDTRRSTAWLGVDVDVEAGLLCTGATRAPGSPSGASGVVAASIPPGGDRRRPEALIAFLAAPFCREHSTVACDEGEPGLTGAVDVEVIGAWFEEGRTGAGDAPIAWVNATGGGVPTRLSVETTATARRPALDEYVAGDDAGWVLGYPSADGGVSLHVVPAFEDPSPTCDFTPPLDPDLHHCLDPMADDETVFPAPSPPYLDRTSPALVVPAAQRLFESAAIAGDVAIALAPAAGGTVRVALAWNEASSVALATATLTIATGAIAPDATVTRFPVTDVRDLALVYVPAGLRLEEGAGFVLTWTAFSGTYAARALVDGTVLAPGHVRMGMPIDHPRAFVEQGPDGRSHVRVLGYQSMRDGFVAFPGVCGEEPPPPS